MKIFEMSSCVFFCSLLP